MKEYKYAESIANLIISLGTAALGLIASFFGWFDGGIWLYAVFGGSAAYFTMAIIRHEPRKIKLYEDELVAPSLNGFFMRRIKYKNIKALSLCRRNNDSFIRVRLKKGIKCTIRGNCVNCIGPRSMGMEPYEDLLNEIKFRAGL